MNYASTFISANYNQMSYTRVNWGGIYMYTCIWSGNTGFGIYIHDTELTPFREIAVFLPDEDVV